MASFVGIAAAPEGVHADSTEWNVPARKARLQNPIPPDAHSIAVGKEYYKRECLTCHGTRGMGDGLGALDLEEPVPDLTNPEIWVQTDGELFWKITTGRKPMPGTQKLLTEEERWHVVNYIRTFARQDEWMNDAP